MSEEKRTVESLTPDVVERMNALVESEVSDEMIKAFIKESFDAKSEVSRMSQVKCPACKHEFSKRLTITLPNFQARAKAIEVLLNRVKGKPKETVKVEQTIKVSTREELESLSVEELFALADAS